MPEQRADELRLPRMVAENTGLHDTAFTVSVDLIEGCATGISARERSRTIRALADPITAPEHLGRPATSSRYGRSRRVLERDGHTEAAVDLSLLAGLSGVTALCEIVGPDWNTACYGHLSQLAARRLMPLISVRDLAAYRLAKQAHES
ncbi:3,4-dihydroxy-2-butanone-4-phosphate synthase [Streptomyces sp. M19]